MDAVLGEMNCGLFAAPVLLEDGKTIRTVAVVVRAALPVLGIADPDDEPPPHALTAPAARIRNENNSERFMRLPPDR